MEQLQAYQALVQNYLTHRKIPEEECEDLGKLILDDLQEDSGLVTNLRELLLDKRIVKTDRTAYIDAQALYLIAYKIDEIPADKRTPRDCKFKLTKQERDDIVFEYGVSLAEDEAERGMYHLMGELP